MAISKRFIAPMPETVLPCIPVRGSVAFPNITINFLCLSRKRIVTVTVIPVIDIVSGPIHLVCS